jgi:hypothetical protein
MDVFSVTVPAPERIPELVRMTPRQSAWGPVEEDGYLWDGKVLGRVSATELPPWMLERLPSRFRTDLGGWRTLHVAQEAQQRYEDALRGRGNPLDLSPILLKVMAIQDDWLVCCVRDIDQRPLEFAAMVPSDVLERVGQIVIGDPVVADLIVWRP